MSTEIQDFAALLRGLKERSGLSYGALAQKLHMSTSTIHRYCNGEAVPHDYAPVERFARVCRATSGELVALHRQWILADEAKRRGARKAEGAGTFEPSLVTSELSAPPSAAEPEPGPEPVNGLETTPEPGRGSGRGPEPEAKAVPEADAEDVTPDARSAGAAPAPGRLSGKRLRVLLATAAVVALTVPTALAINHYSGERTREEGMDTPRSSAPVTPSRSGSSTSPSPSPSKPSPSATSGSASPSATAAKSTASQGAGGKGGKGAAGSQVVPVTATLSAYNWDWPCGQYFLLDRDPKGMPPVPDAADKARRSWAAQLGGVDAGKMLLELTLQGASQEAVVLKALHVRVVKQEAATDWPAYSMGEGCGSGIVPQTFNIDLDDGQPVSRPVAGESGGEVVPAKNFPYQVSSTDVEVFRLDAHTEDHDVTWYLELEWSSGDRSGMLRIDDNGKPFRTAGMRNRPVYEYRRDTAEWEDISASLEGAGN